MHLKQNGKAKKQTRFDFSRAKKKDEFNKVVSGFPSKDEDRHFETDAEGQQEFERQAEILPEGDHRLEKVG